MLTAEEILGLDDSNIQKVDVPEWKNGFVFIRSFTAEAREAIHASQDSKVKSTMARFVAASICDESGKLLFDTPEKIDALSKKSARALQRVFDAVMKLNGIGEKAQEQAVKNS